HADQPDPAPVLSEESAGSGTSSHPTDSGCRPGWTRPPALWSPRHSALRQGFGLRAAGRPSGRIQGIPAHQDEDSILVGGLRVVDEELDNFAAHIGMYGGEELHRLEKADDRVLLHAASDLDVGIRSGLGGAVEGAG